MRILLAAATLLLVGVASALNLVLGAVWVAILVALVVLRRRIRGVDWVVLVLAVVLSAAGLRLGWLAPPPARSYARDEVTTLAARAPWAARLGAWWAGRSDDGSAVGQALRTRLRERRFQELQHVAGDLERRAAAAVAAGRQAGRLAARAPAEAAALEEAVRRLALTLTAPEFRDLQSRRARLEAWFTELEARLAGARDEADLGAIAQGLEPAAIASVSFRALREDLARVDAAAAALVRAVAGGGIRMSVGSRVEYDEAAGQVVVEDRYVFAADPPLRITRVDVGALRQAALGPRASQVLTYGITPAEARQPVGPPEIALAEGTPTLIVVDRRVGPPPIERARTPLRPLPFWRLTLSGAPGPPEFGVTLAVDGGEALLAPGPPGRRLEGVRLPRYAFHHADLPGRLVPESQHETWVPAEPERAGAAGVAVELTPPTGLFRNAVFAAGKSYLYTPNPVVALAVAALAAVAAILTRRRPAAPPSAARKI